MLFCKKGSHVATHALRPWNTQTNLGLKRSVKIGTRSKFDLKPKPKTKKLKLFRL